MDKLRNECRGIILEEAGMVAVHPPDFRLHAKNGPIFMFYEG